MKVFIARLVLAVTLIPAALLAQQVEYDTHFTPRGMRVDYFHSGGMGKEIFALDRVVDDGAWAGSRKALLDPLGFGKYQFTVADAKSSKPIYSRGFASIYGEWETTGEQEKTHRTFHESFRFPWPKHPVKITLRKRAADNRSWNDLWSLEVDPNSRFVNPSHPRPAGELVPIFENGDPTKKVDLLVIGEGYTTAERPKFLRDTHRLVGALFDTEPFRKRRNDFNVRALFLPAAYSGVHRPRTGDHRRTWTGVQYNIFDSERYVLTEDNRSLRDIASTAPYDFLEILVNEKQYGGGGIYQDQATSSVDSAFSEYVFIHEFGHHFAALADEYYTSDVAYQTGAEKKPEPWEPNVTALHDPAKLKWKDLVSPGTPLPTPWKKEEFEKHSREIQARRREIRAQNKPESEMDALFREQMAFESKLLSTMEYSGRVGAFEGASYEQKGLYRPEADCIMFTRNDVPFCRVCSRAIETVIDAYSR